MSQVLEPLKTAAGGPDFAALFEAIPSPYCILDRDLNFVAANPAYQQVTERSLGELFGRGMFELFPDPGESGRRLRASLERVLATGRPDTLALIPYAIRLPSRGGELEMRYWSAVHTPLFGADGRPLFVVQNSVDVTDLQRLKQIAYGAGHDLPGAGERDLLQRALEAEEVNRTLNEETQGLRDLFMQAPSFMAVLSGPEFTFALANSAYLQLIGFRPVIGKTVAEALPEVAEQGFVDLLRQVVSTREPYIGQAVSVKLQRAPDAPLEERFLDFIYQPIVGADGTAWGVFVEGSDVTARVIGDRQQKLLVDELNHRVKNTLATVQAIAAQTLRSQPDPAVFRQVFEARLLALSATHDLLTATSWRSACLRDVVQLEFRPYESDRYRLNGPEVQLSPPETLTLGLLFHELATNAAKHGALSSLEGHVAVDWSVEGRVLNLTWRESGGPPVEPPARRGFGSRLIERSLADQSGEAALDFAPEGLRCRIRLPLADDA